MNIPIIFLRIPMHKMQTTKELHDNSSLVIGLKLTTIKKESGYAFLLAEKKN